MIFQHLGLLAFGAANFRSARIGQLGLGRVNFRAVICRDVDLWNINVDWIVVGGVDGVWFDEIVWAGAGNCRCVSACGKQESGQDQRTIQRSQLDPRKSARGIKLSSLIKHAGIISTL